MLVGEADVCWRDFEEDLVIDELDVVPIDQTLVFFFIEEKETYGVVGAAAKVEIRAVDW